MKNEEIDGDALILLIKNDYKFPDLEVNNRKSILECLEDDMLTFKNNIKENELYKEIYIEEIDKLWKSLKNKLKQLKLGDKLKYMKYLIIKDPPPELEKKNELDDYLNKVIRNEDNINEIQENNKDLLNYDENKLKEKCDEWEIKKDNIFKLKIIIKIIKQNINKSLQKEKINNVDDKDKFINLINTEIIKKEKNEDINKKNENISINNNKEEIKKNSNENIQLLNIENKMIKNIEQSINSKESAIIDEKELIESNINEKKELNNFQNSIEDYSSIDDNSVDDKYLFYSVIEVFEYQTSQKEMTYGLKNSVNEFKRICSDFNIKFENECSYIDYNEAKKKEMSSFMIWGNKKGLNQFLKEKNILNSFYDFINKNDEKKACICLCINLSKKLSYLIIWPGKYNYQYSRIEEPNDGILLTLVRYGFSISSNSIVCLSEEEIDNFDFNGYNIFQDNEESAYETETNVFEIKENNEKKFKIEEKQNLTETIKEKFKNKRITDVKINQNCLLFYEEVGDRTNLAPKKDIKFEKFIQNIKEIDLFFEESFNIPINEFYILINHNSFYIKNNLDNQLDEIIEEIVNIMIKNIFKEIFDKILNKNYLNFICIYCKKNENEDYLYYNSKKINKKFFHKSCYIENHNLNSNNFNFEKLDEEKKEKIKNELYNNCKNNIIENINKNYKEFKAIIESFFKNCENKFETKKSFLFFGKTLVIDNNKMKKEIDKTKNRLKADLEQRKKNIIGKELQIYSELLKDEKNNINTKYINWIKNWKEKINKYFNDNKNKINKWIVLKTFNNIKNDKYISYEYKEIIKQKIVIVNLYEILQYKDSSEFCLSNPIELGDKDRIENYFPKDGKGLIVYKNDEKITIYIKEDSPVEFTGLYDYDKLSRTYFFYKEEDNIKKFIIYYFNEDKILKSKNLDIQYLLNEKSKIDKILLIPCVYGDKNQSVLLFIDNYAKMIKIKDNSIIGYLDLKEKFQFENFNELQIIIYIDFLLILKFNNKTKYWEGKVFSLYNIESDSLFKEIESIELKSLSISTKFSLAEINEKKYLFAINIKDNNPIISYWEIDSQLSDIYTNYKTILGKENTLNDNYNISSGNCVLNYFYHCFDKYPLLGAIQYNLKNYNKKSLKFGFCIKNKKANTIFELKNYLNELKKICQKKKNISFDDINFSFVNEEQSYILNDTSLGDLLINILEVTSIQIAKILGNNFTVMSNGEKIEEKLNKDKKISTTDYSKMIDFCIKESIFDFFKIPVVVICCFGTQSIGKSTFLNELTGSLFDVSGMRCTEGIWMSVKLFINNIKEHDKKCNKNCKQCGKNKCYLMHEYNKKDYEKCLCKDCICGEICFLNENNINNKQLINCDIKCCLKKGHEKLIRCTFEDCNCKCKCECICKEKKKHDHKCIECQKEKKSKCLCECNCKHFCKYPILLHNFICVCLDFEGLGTFERTNEQDIQMALIGSAIGNNVIFRTHNSFDRFTESTLGKLSLGSRKIKSIKIEDFFGGDLFFSPRDVIEKDKNNIKKEFNRKLGISLNNWFEENKNKKKPIKENKENTKIIEQSINKDKKYTIFGLFSQNVFAATPSYQNESFYKTLRNILTRDIIENSLRYQRHPIYKTGNEFCSKLKTFLSAVYMNDYEFLPKFRENEVKNYINDNLEKAFEVIGSYEENEEEYNKNKYLQEKFNKVKLYFNEEYLKKLKIDFVYNNHLENDDSLNIDNIFCSHNIQGNYKLDFGISLNINKIMENNYSIEIKNLNDFGLILMIPKKLKNIINYDDLCSDLFKLWDAICNELKFKEKKIIETFKLFIESLIKRRNKNVYKWLKEMTKNFKDLQNLQNQYSLIDDKWKICEQKCSECYYICTLLKGHEKKHKCPYDHHCKEKCEICEECKCQDENCSNKCGEKSGHENIHTCNHFHQCKKNCELELFSLDCKGRCKLEHNHNGNHNCGVEIHICKEDCNLKDKAKNCKEKCIYPCIYPYPHKGKEHNCGNIHYCLNKCDLFEKSRNCKEYCKLEYGHKENHNCGEKHFCIENCYLKDKAKNCKEKCILEFPHEGKEHNCGNIHYCLNKCNLFGKSRGCKEYCKLEYGHKENHNCGEKHFCIENCYLKDKAKNCKEKCILEFPHEGKEHNCNEVHLCKGKCSLINKSKNCKEECILEYDHKNKGLECICIIKEENHICNKKCHINEDCNKDCILICGHSGKCLCGFCNCTEICKYKDCSRNCLGKCHLKAGHEGNEHLCENKHHYCKFKCVYNGISIHCNKYCHYYFELNPNHNQDSNHICEYKEEMHECNGICHFYNISRECKERCSLKVNHKGDHLCNSTSHLCTHKCQFIEISKKCNELCNKSFDHEDTNNHLCSLKEEEHICKKKCSLYDKPGEKCKEDCCLIAGHIGQCICYKKQEGHICNKKCKFYPKADGCEKYCKLSLNHLGRHICKKSEKEHKCKDICYLYGKTRGNCLKKCCLSYGHKEEHICSIEPIHLCNEKCSLYEKSRECKIECNLPFGHKEEHLCNSNQHFCINKCYYYSKFEENGKGECNIDCCLPYNHEEEKCICKQPHFHPCDKKCSLYNKSRGCNEECAKKYMHEGECFCSVQRHLHTCKELCKLCLENKNEVECGHFYNHNKEENKCDKCKGETCKLSLKDHLCGGQHDCKEECQEKGFCQIETYEEKGDEIYKTKLGQEIKYKIIVQEAFKNKCIIKIPNNEFNHLGKHTCGDKFPHKCGFKCIQCERYCTESKGHYGLHNCIHGNIKNSLFSISDNNEAMVRKDNQYYKFTDKESAKVFFCEQYCREQGQGHTHLFNSTKIIRDENVKIHEEKKNFFSEYIYECKCSYFWENILKFTNNFSTTEDKIFDLCNWHCQDENHQNKEYCQMKLWHDKIIGNEIPKGVSATWISNGHAFKCHHPMGVYTIFLIDQSLSMSSNSNKPKNEKDIINKMNNMLGASIEALLNYCRKRFAINVKDMCALIGFNENATLICENICVGENEEIKNNCLSKLNPCGRTYFINAFKEAKKLLEKLKDKKEYIPVIILLTDGLDFNSEETLKYIENDVSITLF